MNRDVINALVREMRAGLTRARLMQAAAGVTVAWLLLAFVLPNLSVSNTLSKKWEAPAPVLVLGLTVGMTYGLLAIGLVLIYRTNRIINFAHGQVGAFGAAMFGLAVVRWHVPYWVAFFPALALSAGLGALAEVSVIRRLRKAPPIMSVVATLGIGQFLVLFAFAINNQAGRGADYPQPSGMPSFHLGALLVTQAHTGMLLLSPLLVIAISLFFKTSRVGLGIRAAAANPEAARMSAVFASRMSSLAWGIAGAIAAFSAILTQPTRGFVSGDSFGPSLLLIALTAAVLARMQSMPTAMFAGIGIGIFEQLFLWNFGQPGIVQMLLFAIILVAMLVQKQHVGRTEEKGSWAAVQTARPLPAAIAQVATVRMLRPLVLVVGGGILAAVPLFASNATSVRLTVSFAYVVVGLSVGIITGLGGQLSLGQFALGAVGAFVSYVVSTRTGNFFESFFYAGIATAIVSALIGLPALRVKGLLLTVTTLAFALVTPSYLLSQSWLLGGDGVDPGRPIIFGKDLVTGRAYYYVAYTILAVSLWLSYNVRNGGFGRKLVAVRDNEDAARSFTVSATTVKLQGFAIAGFVAGLGGALYGHSLTLLTGSSFPTGASLDVVVLTVIGGLGMLSGPILGALIVQGATYLPLDTAGLAASSFGQLLIIMYLPGGVGGVVMRLRDRIADALAKRSGVDPEQARAAERGFTENRAGAGEAPLRKTRRRRHAPGGVLLRATDLRKSFGGINAVGGVSFEVREGQTVGLIGPNGAGKTTTFELLAGFTQLNSGTVEYAGTDVTALGPEARGRLGLIRSFQDAALFPTLTVLECVELALERVAPTRLLPSLLGIRRGQRERRHQAEELVAWMGLERYRSSQIQELSTGTRRITEIACLIALQPQLLLLDEPSSGVAQRETEALGALLERLKRELNLTLVIIEHDIPLIMGLSDHIVCMADGLVISAGPPEHVRHDPAVTEAYLGGSITAIERSAPTASKPVEVPA